MSSSLWTRDDDRAAVSLLRAVEEDDLAGALLAVEGASLDRELRVRALLDAWGQRVASARSGSGPEEALGALTSVLVGELGLVGAGESYDTPANSHLSEVVDSRHGLPILVTAVWSLVGAAAGIPVEGVGMPFHFIARIGGEGGLLVDPFAGGSVLSQDDCAALVTRFSQGQVDWDPDFLTTSGTQDTVERVLRNLMNTYSHRGDLGALYRVVGLTVALCPDEPHYHLAQARMAELMGHPNVATRLYTDLLQGFEGSEEAELAAAHLVALHPADLTN